MSDSSISDPDRFRRLVVLFLVGGITVLFLFVVKDFLMPLLLAGIFAGLLRPVYRKLNIAFNGRHVLASVVTILLALTLVGLPLIALASVVVGQAFKVSESAFGWVQFQMENATIEESGKWITAQFPMVEEFLPEQEKMVEMVEMFGQAARSSGEQGGNCVHEEPNVDDYWSRIVFTQLLRDALRDVLLFDRWSKVSTEDDVLSAA